MKLLRRKIDAFLEEWKSRTDRMPLIVKGARQIGKTESIRYFAHRHYKNIVEINFVLQKHFKTIFDNGFEPDTIIRSISLLDPSLEFTAGETLIFFDEMQECPNCATSLKFFKQDGRYDVICSGSLMGINYRQIESNSVGYKEDYEMHSMDFEEFLWAKGNTVTMPAIKEAFEKRKPLGDLIHRKTLQLFREYIAVGGMPQAVLEYVNGNSFSSIDRVKQGILSLYEDDLKKYDDNEKEKASLIFKTIPKQLSDHNMHFTFSEINANARYVNYVESVEFVAESMIGNLCANVTMPDVLMELYADRSNFKLYMGDTGLLVSQMIREGDETEDIYRALIYDKLGSNLGMIFENVVAQMLKTSGNALYFHEYKYTPKDAENEKKYEIDFLLVKNKKVCPIEVKSSGYATHKSFDYFKEKYPIKLQERYIIYTKDLKFEDGITYIPAYMAGLL